jgi:hypothetical protein
MTDQSHKFCLGRPAFLGDEKAQLFHYVDIALLAAAADVVGAAVLARVDDDPDGLAVILDVEPVAHVESLAVDRQGFAFQQIQDQQGNQFLGKLQRPVVVRAVAHPHRQAEGAVPGAHQVIARCLGRGIGARRIVAGFFVEQAGRSQRAKHLVGRDVMQKSLAGRPQFAAGFQQIEGAFDVGAQEGPRSRDRAIHVALGRKMHHHVGLVLGKHGPQRREIAQVDPFEGVVGPVGHRLQAAQIGRVGQRVQVDEVVFGVSRHHSHVWGVGESISQAHTITHAAWTGYLRLVWKFGGAG